MTNGIPEPSPSRKARMAGLLYLLTAGSAFAEFVRSSLVVRGDATATATNILASESFYRAGFAADLISAMSYVGVALLLYELLKPVSKSISLLAAGFALAGSAIMAANLLNLLAPLLLLGDTPFLSAFTLDQRQALVLMSLRMHGLGYAVTTAFFGTYCILLGLLIARSTFLPKWLGVLLAVGGLSYLVNSFAIFLNPALAASPFPYILAPAGIAEISLILWLIFIGVNASRWAEQESKGSAVRNALKLSAPSGLGTDQPKQPPSSPA